MTERDINAAFVADADGLRLGQELLLSPPGPADLPPLTKPLGPREALRALAGPVLGGAAHLDDPGYLAHMDPATPWITWVTAQWAARLNQNLLHPDTGTIARDLEKRVVDLLAPVWGMDGGHMVPGSTIANLTALWVARDLRGIKSVVTSEAAHLSVRKACDVLGLAYRSVSTEGLGSLRADQLGVC